MRTDWEAYRIIDSFLVCSLNNVGGRQYCFILSGTAQDCTIVAHISLPSNIKGIMLLI